MGLSGKIALVTGAANGLGRAISEVLLENNCKVCMCDINQEAGEATWKLFKAAHGEDNVIFKKCDVSVADEQEDVFKATIETFKGLDIVVNNAAVVGEKQWDRMLDVNIGGVIRGTYLGFKYMDKNTGGNGGVVLNISSVAGLVSFPPLPAYGATKHAVRSFSQTISLHSAGMYGVRVNTVCLVCMDTDMFDKLANEDTCSEYCFGPNCVEVMSGVRKDHPPMSPRRYAEAMLPLVKEEHLNGQCHFITPDGIAETPIALELPQLVFKPLPTYN